MRMAQRKSFCRDANLFSQSVAIAQARPPMFKHLSSLDLGYVDDGGDIAKLHEKVW